MKTKNNKKGKEIETKKKGRPINPQSKRQQRLSVITIAESSKRRGRPKGSVKKAIEIVEVDTNFQNIYNLLDTKIRELQMIQIMLKHEISKKGQF